jgi:hypothetical protein
MRAPLNTPRSKRLSSNYCYSPFGWCINYGGQTEVPRLVKTGTLLPLHATQAHDTSPHLHSWARRDGTGRLPLPVLRCCPATSFCVSVVAARAPAQDFYFAPVTLGLSTGHLMSSCFICSVTRPGFGCCHDCQWLWNWIYFCPLAASASAKFDQSFLLSWASYVQ